MRDDSDTISDVKPVFYSVLYILLSIIVIKVIFSSITCVSVVEADKVFSAKMVFKLGGNSIPVKSGNS